MIALVIALTLAPISVRAEPVAALPSPAQQDSPSTRSGRTEVGGQTALDAERAFAADARTLGQWTAFRAYAAPEATMFVPQPVNAQAWLKDRKDPATAIEWWPTASYVSCDGGTAVNTGGWKRPDGSVGYFSTVWQRQRDGGWKWIVDAGDALPKARARHSKPATMRAVCDRAAAFAPAYGVAPPPGVTPPPAAWGYATDSSLTWRWSFGWDGARSLAVRLAGRKSPVIEDEVAAPK